MAHSTNIGDNTSIWFDGGAGWNICWVVRTGDTGEWEQSITLQLESEVIALMRALIQHYSLDAMNGSGLMSEADYVVNINDSVLIKFNRGKGQRYVDLIERSAPRPGRTPNPTSYQSISLQALALMRALIQRYPLDALGQV